MIRKCALYLIVGVFAVGCLFFIIHCRDSPRAVVGNAINVPSPATHGGAVIGINDQTHFLNGADSGAKIFSNPSGVFVTSPLGRYYRYEVVDRVQLHLEPGTTVFFPETYYCNLSEIHLFGEAYFSVPHLPDSIRPYTVEANNWTFFSDDAEFNIKAFINDRRMWAASIKGLLLATKGNRIIYIEPGEIAVFDRYTDSVKVASSDYRGWRSTNRLFLNASWSEVLSTVARWYNLKFKVSSNSKKGFEELVNATYDFNSPLRAVLDSMRKQVNIDYDFVSKTIAVR